MSQSLYTAMGGISGAQTDLNVISNNIANINTTAFKSSSVNFSEIYSSTLSSGTAATGTTGGTNPIQVGLGVQVSSISKDFSAGTWVATGKTTDLMIQGTGFFSVRSSDGEIFYTRAGDFSFDSDGDLVTTDGYKVLGTNSILSTSSSTTPVHIPQSIVATVSANQNIATALASQLNNCSLTQGNFNLSVDGNSPISIPISFNDNTTVQDLVTSIQTQINAASTAATNAATNATAIVTAVTAAFTGNPMTAAEHTSILNAANAAKTAADNAYAAGTMSSADHDTIVNASASATSIADTIWNGGTPGTMSVAQRNSINTPQTAIATAQTALSTKYTGVTVACGTAANGKAGEIYFNVDGTNANTLTFSNPTTGASNFLVKTGLATAAKDASNNYTSDVLDLKADVTQVTSIDQATTISSYSIGKDGSIQATYSNGATLAVRLEADGATYGFKYTTAEGVVITGDKVNVDPNVATPANFQIQLASITNNDGLLSVGSNLYSAGPNSGNIFYSIGNAMGLGKIASGGLESSNVDLSSEFSAMILAQRAVQANSRVFTTTSDIMNVIVQMGG